MAQYKYSDELSKSDSSSFDEEHTPGSKVPSSGIYMCVNCRDEVACNAGDPLPPQNHKQHTNTSKPIKWKLLIKTQNGPS